MGRRKIEIQPITHDRNRSVTFLKRKNGLFKKAYELGVLCSVDVCVIVFGHNGKLHEYSSGDGNSILHRRINFAGERDCRRPADFTGDKANGADDIDDEVDSGDDVLAPSASKKPAKATAKASQDPKSTSSTSFDGVAQRMLDARPQDFGTDSNESAGGNHGGPLPPTTHPLNVISLTSQSRVGSYNLLPQGLSQHHQQLAHQYLVQQLQNINPNLNSHASLTLGGSGTGISRPNVPSLNLQAQTEALAAQISGIPQPAFGAGLPPSHTSTSAFSSQGRHDGIDFATDFVTLLSGVDRNQLSGSSKSLLNLGSGRSGGGGTGGFEWPSGGDSRIGDITSSADQLRSESGTQLGSGGDNTVIPNSAADWLAILTGTSGSRNDSSPQNDSAPVFPWDPPIPAPANTANIHRPASSMSTGITGKRSREDVEVRRGSSIDGVHHSSTESLSVSELSDGDESGSIVGGKRSRNK